jgi:hypothetical protein
MKRYLTTFILSTTALCNFITAQSQPQLSFAAERAASEHAPGPYMAGVKSDEAQFTLPLPQRSEWKWRAPETKDRARVKYED